jgi:hypothetical protein
MVFFVRSATDKAISHMEIAIIDMKEETVTGSISHKHLELSH